VHSSAVVAAKTGDISMEGVTSDKVFGISPTSPLQDDAEEALSCPVWHFSAASCHGKTCSCSINTPYVSSNVIALRSSDISMP
jgi:hypothetical protein